MENKLNIGIVGGGLTGLTAAYRLAQKGHKVTVWEKGDSLGGLAGGFEVEGTNLEKAYHHIFRTDKSIIRLTEELGIGERLEWRESSIGLYYRGKMYPFVTPLDLLKFSPLGLTDKLRMGLAAIYLQKTENYEQFEKTTAFEWMKKYCGKRAFEVVWEPLLKGKFHDYYKKVSMAWLWARIHTRGKSKEKGEAKERLGYFNGGFQIVANELERRIKEKGGKIKTNATVDKIEGLKNGKVTVETGGEVEEYDRIIATVPSSIMARLVNKRGYARDLRQIEYLGAINIIFGSKQSLSRFYWHNINDLQSPFLAFIQHTNLVEKHRYGGQEIYYMGNYIPADHRYWQMEDSQIRAEFFEYLKNVFPEFDLKSVLWTKVFRFKEAQHVVERGYRKKIPAYTTPIKNLFLANFSQIYPEDRGTNFAVAEGEKIARLAER